MAEAHPAAPRPEPNRPLVASVQQHYEQLLSGFYSWMAGGFEQALARNADFFARHGIAPTESGVAVDLGAACGFQSIPLKQLGFAVTAVDFDRGLLEELRRHEDSSGIEIVEGDLLDFDKYLDTKAELVVCMTDAILHLESVESVHRLFSKVADNLAPGGKFILSFRDLSVELPELDRFIPVRSDEDTIFSCFIEYEPETAKIYDLVYKKEDGQWRLYKSFYRKLRLSLTSALETLDRAGFSGVDTNFSHGSVTLIAVCD